MWEKQQKFIFLFENSQVERNCLFIFSCHSSTGVDVTGPAPVPGSSSPAIPLDTHNSLREQQGKPFHGEIQSSPLGFSALKVSLNSHTAMKEFLATLTYKIGAGALNKENS